MVVLLVSQLVGWSRNKYVVTLQAATPYLLALALRSPSSRSSPDAGSSGHSRRSRSPRSSCSAGGCASRRSNRRRRLPATAARVPRQSALLQRPHGRHGSLARRPRRRRAGLHRVHPGARGWLLRRPVRDLFPSVIEPGAEGGRIGDLEPPPLTRGPAPPALYLSTAAVVAAPDPVTLYVVHPPNPLVDLDDWLNELAGFAGSARAVHRLRRSSSATSTPLLAPAVPPSRAPPVGATPHQVAGPWVLQLVARRQVMAAAVPPSRPRPRRRSLVVTDVVDVDLAGSDHHGLVVTVAVRPTAPAGRAGRSRRPRAATDGSSTASSPRRGRSARRTSPGSTAGSPSPPPDR